MSATAPIRVAVVGAGGWGEQHARVFSSRPDTELVAIVARTPESAQRRASAYDTTPYTDISEMLERAKPDLVTTSLPNEGHFAPTLELVRAGVPLLVEKPLVFDVEEANTLIEEARSRDLFFAIDFNHRYAEAVQRAKAAIESGELGEIVFATWRFGGFANPGQSPYRNLFETQCHGFDMLEHLAGPVASLMAEMGDVTDSDAYHSLAISLRFAGGGVGSMLGSYETSYAYPDAQLIEVNGTRGRLTIHDTVKRLELSRLDDETRQVWEPGYFNDAARTFTNTFDRYVEDLLRALRIGEAPPVPATAGQRAVALGAAAVRSFEQGVRVTL